MTETDDGLRLVAPDQLIYPQIDATWMDVYAPDGTFIRRLYNVDATDGGYSPEDQH